MKFDISYGAYNVQFDGAVYSAQPANNRDPEGFIYLYSSDLETVIHAIDAIYGVESDIPVWLQEWCHKDEDTPADHSCNYINLDHAFAPVENLPAAIANALDPNATEDADWPLSPERMSFSPVKEGRFQF